MRIKLPLKLYILVIILTFVHPVEVAADYSAIATSLENKFSVALNNKKIVTFDFGGFSENIYIDVNTNDTISEITAPNIDGYYFDGWYLNNQIYDFSTPITQNICLKAKYLSLNDDDVKTFSIYHHHVYSGNITDGNNTNASKGPYDDSYYRNGSGGCFTNYYTSSISSGYYSRNCGLEEHVHTGSSSSGGGCYGKAVYRHEHTSSCKYYRFGPHSFYIVRYNKDGSPRYKCSLCGGEVNQDGLGVTRCSKAPGGYECGFTPNTLDHYEINCGKTAHTHSGNSSSGGGCYGSYHSGSTIYYYNRGCGHTDGELLAEIKLLTNGGVLNNLYTEEANGYRLSQPVKDDCEFLGWVSMNNEQPQKDIIITRDLNQDMVYIAKYKYKYTNLYTNY